MFETLFLIVLSLMATFLILLVLVQRGRGGGLAGAFGGSGGSSAFGAKAGDTFTRITIYAASIWIVTCIFASYWAGGDRGPLADNSAEGQGTASQPDDAGMGGAAGADSDADSSAAEPAASTEDASAEDPSAEGSGPPALGDPGAGAQDEE